MTETITPGVKEGNIMWLAILLQLIPTLVKIVEGIFAGVPKSGAEKKALVMSTLDDLVGVADANFSGGAKATWEQIKPSVGLVVDTTAKIVFPSASATSLVDAQR